MKLGIFCVGTGIGGFIVNLVGIVYGDWGYARGVIFMPVLILFGLYLIKRAKHRKDYLESVKNWAKENPEQAQQWLKRS